MRNLSAKQTEILATVIRMNPDGTFVDLDQLLAEMEIEA